MDPIRVVVHFRDNRLIKGYTKNFNPMTPSFHLTPEGSQGQDTQAAKIEVSDLKAVFFVKTFTGNRDYEERKVFTPQDRAQGRKVEVTFADGEVLQGSTVGYDPQRIGFFIIPADPLSNNVRIFVVSAAVKNFRFL
jgi:hypothetical protein